MEHLINLNFAPGGLPATVHVSQYDDTIRQLRFQLWFGRSKVEVPSGASVRVDIKKPDGHIVLVNGTVNSSDRSIVTVPTTKQMTAVPGGSRGTLVVSSTGDKRISSAIFILQVHRDPVEDGDASDSDLSMLQDAIDQTAANASAAQAAASEAQQAAASFQTDTTLSISGKAADAKKTGDELTAIKADLDIQAGVIGAISLIKDYYIKTSDTPISLIPISSSVRRMCAVVDCTAGDKFIINAFSNSSQVRAWCFVDNTNNAISMADANVPVTGLELTAPENAVKLIINDISGGMSYKVGNNLANWIDRSGLSQDARAALLTCLEHVAWIDEHGQTYYNALKDALYPGYWDYEWDATSGVAPSKYFDSYEHDFIKYPDGMYADNFYFDFNHVGDVDILFVAKMATEARVSTYRTPQISVRSAQGSNGYDGFKVVFSTPSGKVETNLSGDFVSTDIDYTNYHEYRVKYKNGVGYLYVDGILAVQGAGVTNNQYIYMTGIFATSLDENGHPNISESNYNFRMVIKSVKYKGLS